MTPPELSATSSQATKPSSGPIIATLLVATFVVILNETVLNVALPRLMGDLGVDERTVQWLATAFMLTMSVVIPTTGFLLARFSTRTVFILAMGLFSLGTLSASLSPNFEFLLVSRVVQASGTAVMLPLLMTTILQLVPSERRGTVMGNVSIAISVAPAIGPSLSGLILEHFSWRWIFLFVLPVALFALVFGAFRLKSVSEPRAQKLDLLSVFLTIPGFGGFVYGISTLSEGLKLTNILILVVGITAIVLFVFRQLSLQKGSDPLLDLRVFSFSMFRRGLLLLILTMICLFGIIILLPLYFQNVRGLSTLATGLILLPGGLVMGLSAPTVGRLYDRIGPKVPVSVGTLLTSLTIVGMTQFNAHTPVWVFVTVHIIFSIALALIFTPAFTTALNPLPPHLYSHGSATLSTLQQLAGGFGTALLVGIMQSVAMLSEKGGALRLDAQMNGISTALWIAAAVGLLAFLVALGLRKEDPPAVAEEASTAQEAAEPTA